MKTTIFYFSGTGNSLAVAQQIAAKLDSTFLVRIQKPFPKHPDVSADRIGIVFPVYMWGLPGAVKEFAAKLGAGAGKYIFAVTTYGGFPAATLHMLSGVLVKGGMKLSAGFGMRMPGNYVPMYGALESDKQQEIFNDSKGKIAEIAETVKRGAQGRIEKGNWLINAVLSGLIYNLGIGRIPVSDKKFFWQPTCTKCGICAKICPVENIKLVEGRPQWQHHCEGCLACLQWCPVEAIQYGKKTIGRKRYRHPEVGVKTMLAR
jgi:ferredoxin